MIKEHIYNVSPYHHIRIHTREVKVGGVGIGGHNPVRLQSMTNTSTTDIEATVAQAERIIRAGGELVRMAVTNKKEVQCLAEVKKKLREKGYQTPLVADTHFNADIAIMAAAVVEKVRINPGNFLRSKKTSWEETEYQEELMLAEEKMIPLIKACKQHSTAIRIGSNHGSLSPRIIFRYGDTPEGMVHAALEFVRICVKHDFYDIVLSMKSSNTRVMVQAYRLLMHEMLKTQTVFPLHLGVTEAGAGEDGRIKSAVGIGALLLDGLGDTIRVSLTEDPELEIPVAIQLKKLASKNISAPLSEKNDIPYHPFEYKRRNTINNQIAGLKKQAVIFGKNSSAEYYVEDHEVFSAEDEKTGIKAVFINRIDELKKVSFSCNDQLIILQANETGQGRNIIRCMDKTGLHSPLILKIHLNTANEDYFQLYAAAHAGIFLLDGLADGIWLENPSIKDSTIREIAQNILQASRARMFKTEFISCPGCGRTLFDLQATSARIREALSHLKGLKIGIMGCIVNGPGEMADADYGYVGAAKGRITLYKNKRVVKKNIPEAEALDELIALIKENGDWKISANKHPE